jgi:hypothetical protein
METVIFEIHAPSILHGKVLSMDGDPSTITKVCKKLSDFGVDLASVQKLGRTAARLEAVEFRLARSTDGDEETEGPSAPSTPKP